MRHSHSRPNEEIIELEEYRAESDNIGFLNRAVEELAGEQAPVALIGLVGSRDVFSVTVRRAQRILRWDHRPSLWSHAFIVSGSGPGGAVHSIPIREVAISSRAGELPDPAFNAVTSATLGHYASATLDANLALMAVRVDAGEAERVVARAGDPDQLNLNRIRYDLWTSLGLWQSYLWTQGTDNPLHQGVPIAASSLIEHCFEEIRLDLAPGASERNSAPEHLWNGARFWTETFEELDRPVRARYVVRDPAATELDPGDMQEAWIAARKFTDG